MDSRMDVDERRSVGRITDIAGVVRAIESFVNDAFAEGEADGPQSQTWRKSMVKKITVAYSRAMEATRCAEDVMASFGVSLLRLEEFEQAWIYFLKVLLKDRNHKRALAGWMSACCRVIPRWHFFMVNDAVRNFGYETALRKTIGSYGNANVSVLDIGAGCGILSLMAMKAGAHRAYACEMSPVVSALAECAIDLFKQKHPDVFVENDVKLLPKHSSNVKIPEDMISPAQVCVTETFDSGLFGEHAVSSIRDAWKRLLYPPDPRLCGRDEREMNNILFGSCFCEPTVKQTKCFPETTQLDPARSVVIPFRACLWAVLIEADDIAIQIKPKKDILDRQPEGSKIKWNDDEGNYECDRLAWLPNGYKFLCDPVRVTTLDFMNEDALRRWNTEQMGTDFTLTTTVPGRPDCIVTWFNLHLSPTVTVTSHPGSNSCWEQAIYPIEGRRFDEIVPAGTEISMFTEKDITIERRGLRFCAYVEVEASSDDSDSEIDSDEEGEEPITGSRARGRQVAADTKKPFDYDHMRHLNTDAFNPTKVGDVVVQLGGHWAATKTRFPKAQVYVFGLQQSHAAKEWMEEKELTPSDIVLFPLDPEGLLEADVCRAWADIRPFYVDRVSIFPKTVELKVRLVRSATLAKMWSVQRNTAEVRRVDKDVMECVSDSMGRVMVPYQLAITPGSIKDITPCSDELSVVTINFVTGSNLKIPFSLEHKIKVFGGEWPNAVLARFCVNDSGQCWQEFAVKFDPRFIDGVRKPVMEIECKILSDGMVEFARIMREDDYKSWKPRHRGKR